MRLIFFGTPADAVAPLRALAGAEHDMALVVTQPDRRRSRGGGSSASPVKAAAEELGLAVRTPERSREVVDEVRAIGADLGVVVAFGQLLPVSLLDAVAGGFVNVHFSLLPRWRGAAPVERALLAGDAETGVCLMRVEAGLDTGPVYARAIEPIHPHDTAGELRSRLVDVGTRLLVERIDAIPRTTPEPQDGEPTYADKLEVQEFRLDPRRPAAELDRLVRAGNPRPGAWFVHAGHRVKVWRARALASTGTAPEPGAVTREGVLGTVHGLLELEDVQPQGKRTMPVRAWLAGVRGDVRLDAAPS